LFTPTKLQIKINLFLLQDQLFKLNKKFNLSFLNVR